MVAMGSRAGAVVAVGNCDDYLVLIVASGADDNIGC